ncbi:MAG: tetratricopeptide repeat protein [Planctomycetota bacterium]
MKREPIVFVVVLLVLALMTYSTMQETAPRAPRISGGKNLEAFQLAEGDPVVSLPAEGNHRDLLRKPSADEPLEPLLLPDPTLDPLAVLIPPPMPDCGSAYWSDHLLRLEPTILGGLDDLVTTGAESEDLSGLEISGADAFADQDEQYQKVYDWIRLNPLATIYGHLLGDQRYDYEVGDTLKFTQVDPHTGKERFGQVEFNGEQYEAFGFADNLHNRIELGVREQRTRLSAARVVEIGDYVHWLLDQGLADPSAFSYAEELARETIRLSPNDVGNWMLLGEVWERTFLLDQAFALYATLAGEDLGTNLPEFGIEVETGRFGRAAGPRVRMGVILRRLGLDADAETQFRLSVDLASGDPAAPMELGILLLDTGRIAEGTQHLERAMAMQAQRNSASGLRNAYALGQGLLRSGRWADASQAFQDAGRAAGNNQEAAMRAESGRIAATYLSGDFTTARSLAGAAIEKFGADATLLYLRGITEAADGGAAGEVIRDLRASAAATPFDAAPALSAQAFWLDRIGESIAAREALNAALELSPSHLYSRYLLAHWAARDGDLSGAKEELVRMVRQAPACAAILAEFGNVLYQEGQEGRDGSFARAEVAYQSLEDLFPDWVQGSSAAPSWAGLVLRHGLNQMQLSSLEEAMSSFDHAVSLDAGLTAARNAKGVVLYREGDLEASVAEFAYLLDALREQEDDPQFVYADTWQGRVVEHDKLRRWTDAFEGSRLRPGWDKQSEARAGVEPRLEDNALLIQGEHTGAGETRAFRTVAGVAFRDFATDLIVGKGHRGEAGAYIALRNRSKETWSFRVNRDREGLVGWTMTRGTRTESGRTSFNIPEGGSARISFRVNREPKQPILTVRVDDEVIFSEAVSNLRNPTGRMATGLVARTAHALPVDTSIDNIELVYAIP